VCGQVRKPWKKNGTYKAQITSVISVGMQRAIPAIVIEKSGALVLTAIILPITFGYLSVFSIPGTYRCSL
jgi:hypothetical protein